MKPRISRITQIFIIPGATPKLPLVAWGWMVLLATPKLEDSLGGATRR